MVASAFTAPHVTEFLTVDVTRMVKLRSRIAARPEFAGVKVSPLLFVAKALLLAAARHPMVNSSWRSEEHTSELQSRQYLVCRLLLEKNKKPSRPTPHAAHCLYRRHTPVTDQISVRALP